ncbi:hypothetical protein [Sagittula salina]|uniref:TonB-dependent receptor n=1 Tax=Sagittula salina TaxID=2820268 RepID=A0A940S5C2_9RHOB|nr:hypothetical protein [Sagittula salina]MBP0484835.1 hypothetical protein [Sagittula salina]
MAFYPARLGADQFPFGNEDPYGGTELSRDSGTAPQLYDFFGMHAQSQFVPAELVEAAEVNDSSISAEHGGFQGGVVNYEPFKPSLESKGKLTYSYQDDSSVSYSLGTEDGDNPDDVAKPEFRKRNLTFSQSGPIGEKWSYVLGFSRQTGWTRKDIEPQYGDAQVESESRSDFYRVGLDYEFDNGGTLSVTGNVTDYEQQWDASSSLSGVDVESRASMLATQYEREYGSLDILGAAMSNVKLSFAGIYTDNESVNQHSDTVWFTWYGRYNSYGTDAFDDWRDAGRVDGSESRVACRRGGAGDRSYEDKNLNLSARLSGDIPGGSFKSGLDVTKARAKREGEGLTFNSATSRLTDGSSYTCAPDDPACSDTQAHRIRILQNPYDVRIDAMKAGAVLQFGKEFQKFSYTLGLRADYNDVLKNTDVAPRVKATWKPPDRFSASLGANRYYSDNYLAYAIHDAIPRGLNQRRTVPTSGGGTPGDWNTARDLGGYYYSQGDLKTPYTDEITLGFSYRDPWSEGH